MNITVCMFSKLFSYCVCVFLSVLFIYIMLSFFWSPQQPPMNPSSALLKATLVNSAVPIGGIVQESSSMCLCVYVCSSVLVYMFYTCPYVHI